MIEPMIDFLLNFKQKDIEPQYREYLNKVRKMNGPGNIQILSKTCSFIDEDKCYLEIGTHRGCTLIGASLNNPDKKFYGVDNFCGHNSPKDCDPFATIKEGLEDAIKRLTNGNVNYFEEGYESFFTDRIDVDGRKVEVYLYDGDHQKQNQYLGMKLAIPTLADRAIVFVDDCANNDRSAVWGAIDKLLEEDERFSVIREFAPRPGEMHKDFWCGFLALKFEK